MDTFRLIGAFEATRNRTQSDRGTESMVDMPPVRHTAKKWKRRASERLFAPRDYNGYGKAGLNPLEWAYEWSPFSVIIGALSTAQCRARNWHAKIGCDPIVGYCPIPSYRRTVAPALSPRGLSFRIFRRFDFLDSSIVDRFTRADRRKEFPNEHSESRMSARLQAQKTRLLSHKSTFVL